MVSHIADEDIPWLQQELGQQAVYLGSSGTLWWWGKLWEAGKPAVKYAPVEVGIQGTEVIITAENWPGTALWEQEGRGSSGPITLN